MTIRRMRIACWKFTNTLSEYVILIAFPLQQWLHERASVLQYTYIACLVTQIDKKGRCKNSANFIGRRFVSIIAINYFFMNYFVNIKVHENFKNKCNILCFLLGELPERKHTTFRTQRKVKIKKCCNICED